MRGVLSAALLVFMVACSAPGGEAVNATREAASANQKTAYDFFVLKGLTNFQASGIVGNLIQESGVDPAISQSGGGPGRGIAQWSAGDRWDTAKGDNVVAFATMQNESPTSLNLQLEFIWYELQTFSDYGFAKLKAASNVSDASIAFEDDYEGCVQAVFAGCDQDQRITYSKQVLATYGNDVVQGAAGAGAGGAGGQSAGGAAGAAGGSAAGVGGALAGSAGSGASGAAGDGAGGTSSAGSAGVAGSSAGAPTAGSAGSGLSGAAGSAEAPAAAADGKSSCSFTPPRRARPADALPVSAGWAGLVLALSMLRRRRRQPMLKS